MTRRFAAEASKRAEGSASVELALLTPVILLVLVLVIAAGRLVTAHAALDTAAAAAARAGSLARTGSAALAAASTTAHRTLDQRDLHCGQHSLLVDTGGFKAGLGQPGTVTVRLSCTVALADLVLPGMPGTVPLSTDFMSPLDPYREKA